MPLHLYLVCVGFWSALCALHGWYHARRISTALGYGAGAYTYGVFGALLSGSACFAFLLVASIFQTSWVGIVVSLLLAQLSAFVVPLCFFVSMAWQNCFDAIYLRIQVKFYRPRPSRRNIE